MAWVHERRRQEWQASEGGKLAAALGAFVVARSGLEDALRQIPEARALAYRITDKAGDLLISDIASVVVKMQSAFFGDLK
jgi:hypothetical protein